jgi:membrane-associated protease RseP (regulator of RpoE activity)
MKNPHWKRLGATLLLVAAPVVVVVASQSPWATAAEEEANGRIVEISPDADESLPEGDQSGDDQATEAPKYWIGLQGLPITSPALRTHLQLADDVGVLVENVVPGSPAEKAGLRQHDVLVAVNGEPISDLRALQKVVANGADKPIELKVIRLAKETKVAVTPEERPADAEINLPNAGVQGPDGPIGDIEGLLRQFQDGGVPGGMRGVPGMELGGRPFNLNKMPSGISVNVTRQGDGPAEITVKKGDETWTLKSDDEKAIKNLPDDVRPFVQQLLGGSRPAQPGAAGGMRFNFGDLQQILPDHFGELDAPGGVDHEALRKRAEGARKRTEQASERLLERMEQMEQRIRDLQEQMQENPPAPRTNGGADPSKS